MFSVTTLHPIGWSVQKIHKKLQKKENLSDPVLNEHENPVILVHGIFHNSTAFYQLEKSIRRANFQSTRTVELWTSINSMKAMAAQLKKEAYPTLELAKLNRKNSKNDLKLRIVSHSLGGIVARIALLDKEFAKLVDKVIFLGTPHQGSQMFNSPFPACFKEIKAGTSLIEQLKNEPLPGGIRYFNLRGELDLVTPASRTFLPSVPNLSFASVGHAGLLSNPQVIQSVVEILESPFYDSNSESEFG